MVDKTSANNEPSLTRQATSGAMWSLASNITVSALSFLGTAVLARLLNPHDFGLIGMATLVIGVVQLFGNFGLGSAIVQKMDVTHEDLCTVHWANIAAGIVLMLLCIIISPLAAHFFREQSVQGVLICLAFTFIISAISSVHNTLIYKNLQMKPLAVIEVSGRVLRIGVMLVAAYHGLNFWSIVIGMIVERIFKTIGFHYLIEWRPSWFFSWNKFKEMFRFGRNLLGGGLAGYANQNMDFIVTGRAMGADQLGYYQMAFNLPNLIRSYLCDSFGNVVFPVFSKIQDDNELLAKGFSKIVKYITLTTFPILFGLAFTTHDFILVVYGEKWLPVVVPMQILCFSAALATSYVPVGGLLNAKGRPDLAFKWGVFKLPVTVIAILLGVYFGGIIGVAWGMFAVDILNLILIYEVYKILKADMSEYVMAIFPAIVASLLMVAVLWGLRFMLLMFDVFPLARLSFMIIIGATVYATAIFLGFRDIFNEFVMFSQKIFFGERSERRSS